MSKIRVLVVDDHALVREGVSALLNHYDDIEVVGEASDGNEAVTKASQLMPHIVLMDIAMPGLGGFEAMAAIKKANANIKVMVMSQYGDREYVRRFLKAGANGYILKKAVGTELISAIRTVAGGEFYLHPSVAGEVVGDYLRDEPLGDENSYDALTDRERQVLKLIAEGHTYKEIGKVLGISVKTVTTHQGNLSEKLGIHSKASLIKFAIQKGIIKVDIS